MDGTLYPQVRLNELAGIILDSAIAVHKEMGPGLLEAVYHQCLFEELKQRNVFIQSMVPAPLSYKSKVLNKDYGIDILVDEQIIVELKSVETLLPVHEAQVISYLKLAKKQLGFLINFNVPLLKERFKRFINKELYKPK
jgi:GxxExxY protein